MARTTAELVMEIIEVDVVRFPSLTPFINAASNLVSRVCGESGYNEETLELIERWIAAHFYAIADPRLKQDTTSKSTVTFDTKIGKGLEATMWGQQALLLDDLGSLSSVNANMGKRKAFIYYAGYDDDLVEDPHDAR